MSNLFDSHLNFALCISVKCPSFLDRRSYPFSQVNKMSFPTLSNEQQVWLMEMVKSRTMSIDDALKEAEKLQKGSASNIECDVSIAPLEENVKWKVYNFGVQKLGESSSDNKCILQLDFPSRLIYILKGGHIQNQYHFLQVKNFDVKDDGLIFTITFDNKDLELNAESKDEKHGLCRLLGLVLEDNDISEAREKLGIEIETPEHIPKAKVYKDDIVEKKGNSAITIWARRRLVVEEGEFSYFKPNEDVALHVVLMRQGAVRVKRSDNDIQAFTVTVDERSYYFKVLAQDKTTNGIKQDRESWIKAFNQACQRKRLTAVFLEKKMLSTPHPASSSDARLSDVLRIEPVMHSVTSQRPRPPRSKKQIHKQLSKETISQGHPTKVEMVVNTQEETDEFSMVFEQDKNSNLVEMNKGTTASVPMHVLEVPVPGGQSQVYLAKQKDSSIGQFPPADYENSEPSHRNTSDSSQPPNIQPASPKLVMPTVPTSPPVPATRRLLSPPPPPPTSSLTGRKDKSSNQLDIQGKARTTLKQVYWSPISASLIPKSVWQSIPDVMRRLNIDLIDEKFSIKTINQQETPTLKKSSKVLMDHARAQNLGILLRGMKLTRSKLVEVLTSVEEDESMGLDKMKTIRRYQPSEDDREMYKLYLEKIEQLDPVDRFMADLCTIPYLDLRFQLLQSLWEFPEQCESIIKTLENLSSACEELLQSEAFVSVLFYILAIGNYLNSSRGPQFKDQKGFDLMSLSKLADTKGNSYNYTFLHCLYDHLKNATPPHLLHFDNELLHVPYCEDVSMKALFAAAEVQKNNLRRIKTTTVDLKKSLKQMSEHEKKFFQNVQIFVEHYSKKIKVMERHTAAILDKYNQILKKFGEPSNTRSDDLFTSICSFLKAYKVVKNGSLNQ